MHRNRVCTVLAVLLCLGAPLRSDAQIASRPELVPAAPGHLQRLTLTDGSRLVGRILSVDSTGVRFESALGVNTIQPALIVSVENAEPRRDGHGAYEFANPNATRLILAPTGRQLQQGEGYVSDFWVFFPSVAAGMTNRVTLGGGLSVLPGLGIDQQVFFVTPKVGVIQRERFNAAVGALALILPRNWSDTHSAGVVYGVGTWGGTDASVTAGVGYGYLGGTLARQPVAMLGGEQRLSERLSLVSENYLFPRSTGALSAGIRFLGRDLSVDLAFMRPITSGDNFFFPLLGFMWKW